MPNENWYVLLFIILETKDLAKFGSFALSRYCFRVQRSQLKILVFPKNSPGKWGNQSHLHMESALLYHMHVRQYFFYYIKK